MKTINYNLIQTLNTLQSFSEKKLPQKVSYAITRNLIQFQRDYECYSTLLNKLLNEYNKYFVKDSEENLIMDDKGIPIINDEHVLNEFNNELNALLNIEVEIDIYYISDEAFDYEDNSGRYDVLSAKDIMLLQSILCRPYDEKDVKNDNANVTDGK